MSGEGEAGSGSGRDLRRTDTSGDGAGKALTTPLARHGVPVVLPRGPDVVARPADGADIGQGWVGALLLAEQWLAVGGLDGVVRVLDRRELDLRRRFTLPGAAVQALALGPDGRLYAGGADGAVVAWGPGDARPGRLSGLAGVDGAPIGTLVAVTQTERLYVADLGGSIRAFDRDRQRVAAECTDVGEAVQALVVGPVQERLYVATPGGVLAGAAGGVPAPLPGGEGRRMRALVLAGAGRWLCAGGDEPGVLAWDLRAGGEPRVLASEETVLALAADGATVYGGGSGGGLYAWDLALGRDWQWRGHAREVTALAPGRAEDGAVLLASGGLDGRVHLWRLPGAGEAVCAATLEPAAEGFVWTTPAEPGIAAQGWFYSDRPERHCRGPEQEHAAYIRAQHRPELVRARVHDWQRYRELCEGSRPRLEGLVEPPRLTNGPAGG